MEKACKKHVYDMHYEVRIQSVINYHFEKNNVKLVKKDARAKTLTKEEYMHVKYIRTWLHFAWSRGFPTSILVWYSGAIVSALPRFHHSL